MHEDVQKVLITREQIAERVQDAVRSMVEDR